MIIQRLVDEFRYLITDAIAPYRFSDSEALSYVNKALTQLAKHVPTLFTAAGVLTLGPGSRQPKPYAHLQIFNVICNRQGPSLSSPMGPVITEVSPDIMTAISKTWMSDFPSNTVEHVVQMANSNDYFYVYPPIETVGYVEVYHNIEAPTFSSLNSDLTIPKRYLDAIPYFMAYMSYLPDSGSEGNLEAAKAMYAQYMLTISENLPKETVA